MTNQLHRKGYRLTRVCFNQAEEILGNGLRAFYPSEGVVLNNSPAFAPQSNGPTEST